MRHILQDKVGMKKLKHQSKLIPSIEGKCYLIIYTQINKIDIFNDLRK